MTVAQYNQCVEAYADGVYRFILKNMKDEDEARDVVQEAYTRMWEKSRNINHEKAKSYLFSTAYHAMIDRIRKNKRMSVGEEYMDHSRATEGGYSDLSEILNRAVDMLPEKQKHVLLLRDYEGYSYDEIGGITNLNESQVKVYIYRARKALREYIGSLDKVL
ncbi:MAG TPA: RNA polymerase sigma factor [Bacteroidales bacterium]|nr:RNA polymerase sigma factor [Bacteroidales bacterium]